jgi:hypothetical protein
MTKITTRTPLVFSLKRTLHHVINENIYANLVNMIIYKMGKCINAQWGADVYSVR